MIKKITAGVVITTYNEDGTPLSQEFVAGDEVIYENDDGEQCEPPLDEIYLPFDMVQPN